MIPPLEPGSCQLWWASAGAEDSSLLEVLDQTERRRYENFVRPSDRSRFAVSHALTRIVAGRHVGAAPGALGFAAVSGDGTKPRLVGAGSGLQFSIAHSGSRVVLAISSQVPLGVDIERVSRGTVEASMLSAALSGDERRALAAIPAARRPWAFSRYWTRKEALLKATGHGLAISPHKVVVSAPIEAPALVAWADSPRPAGPVHLYDLEGADGDLDAADGYCAALATLGAPLRPLHHDGDALLGGVW